MQRLHGHAAGALAVLIIGAMSCAAQTSRMQQSKYDGRWWNASQASEREGFVAGYLDCYKYDLKGPAKFEAKSIVAYRDLVSKYFVENTTRANQAVASALSAVADKSEEKAPRGGEIWMERHSYFDGTYWRQAFATGGLEAQRGFVEGYLACDEQVANNRNPASSIPPSELVARINRWYQFDPETGDVETTREKAKIADVLARVRSATRMKR